MVGIISYGVYIPRSRLSSSEIAQFWGKSSEGLGVLEKSVAGIDEDATTMAVEASLRALQAGNISTDEIKALSVGSESHPYAVKPTSTIVGEILGIPNNYLALDTQFACKAATAAMVLLSMMVRLKRHKYGLVIGSDAAQAKMGDALEYTAGSAAAAFILGQGEIIAEILGFTSYSSDTPDFWRRDGQKFPSHAGRFTGEPSYFHHVLSASTHLFKKMRIKASDVDFAVFHMPNAKFPKQAAKKLGFIEKQLEPGFIVSKMGNPYSASSLTGLAAVLDIAKPGQKIFLCSYGSGAGSDAFVFKVTDKIKAHQKNNKSKVASQLEQKTNISYPEYLKVLHGKEYI